MSRRGRPCADWLPLVEQAAAVLIAEPGLSANKVVLLVRGRRKDVLRLVRVLRTVQDAANRRAGADG